MQPRTYDQLSDTDILALCCWREARGESLDAKIAQCWSVKNRVLNPSWWNDLHGFQKYGDPKSLSLYQRTILKPWQYSSFNAEDPNEKKWPPDDPNNPEYQSGQQAQQVAESIVLGSISDPTGGATHYYDMSIEFPKAWGSQAEWENTLNVGRLRFWKMKPTNTDPATGLGADESTQV